MGTGPCGAFVDTGGGSHAACEIGQGTAQRGSLVEHAGEIPGVRPYCLRSPHEATLFHIPYGSDEQPVLDAGDHEFGIHLGEDAPRVGTAPLVEFVAALSQLEQQFDLPAHPHQGERRRHVQEGGRGVGDEDRPRREGQSLGGHVLPPPLPFVA